MTIPTPSLGGSVTLNNELNLVTSVFSSVKLEKSYKHCKVAVKSYMGVVLCVTTQNAHMLCVHNALEI